MDMTTVGFLLCTCVAIVWALAEAVEKLPR